MARPSKLSQAKKDEIKRRHLAGEGVTALAKEYKVSKATISVLVSKRTTIQKEAAKQLATAEIIFENLPVSEQVNVRGLADQLKGISSNLIQAAMTGSATAKRINELVYKHALLIEGDRERLEETATGEAGINEDALKRVIVLTKAANDASQIPLNLLAANKEQMKGLNELENESNAKKLHQMSDDELFSIATSGSR